MTRTAGTVLVADDDSDMRSLYRCWLASSGDVLTAADGVEALAALDETVDVVVLDREMPRKDGVAVARELDRRDAAPGVVMISGVRPGADLLDVPVDDYLQKPVDRETVLSRIERAAAVAGRPTRHRRLAALETRRRIVEVSVPREQLLGDPTYQRAVETLEDADAALERVGRDVASAVDRSGRDRRPPSSDPSLRESP
ncbi:response regulator transcription factor [Haloarcula onubensis]|uniref:Response regulator n=1 Tax=Haloarcula onubensis TaxID=2950539 RepID=A0ABU2FKU7_9EURY|nr:response regulator [Halomicroarcula sp. S3CR25-11]MDS0281384.1 response regulator [Halomicroarcula sp. S3CR25-11]